jgi:hypothetical protein
MPHSKKRLRTAAGNAEATTTPTVAASPLTSSSEVAASDTYQLTVVNTCLANEDIRLPHAPTPALLSWFYSQCGATEEGAACTVLGLTPWKADFWLRRVAHVPLGRHSSLPGALRLRHDCVSRLHARVVYVRTAGMHKRFAKYFPYIEREAHDRKAIEHAGQEPCSCDGREGAEEDADVIIMEPDRSLSVTSPPPPSSRTDFVAPYYLIVNYSENPIYVGQDCISRGRSARLQEGDVVSFLECAFDNEGGIFDRVQQTPQHSSAESTAAAVDMDTLIEPTRQLVCASLQHCSSGPLSHKPVFPLCVHRRLLAYRRLYDVPSVVHEYARWWYAQTAGSISTDAARSPSRSNSRWLVSGNHLVRATSASTTPERPSKRFGTGDEGNADVSPAPVPVNRRGCGAPGSAEPLFDNTHALLDPVVAASLRQWLDDTEDLEEFSTNTQSPLSARLTLDRAWLRSLVRRVCDSQLRERIHSAGSSLSNAKNPFVKAEEEEKEGSSGATSTAAALPASKAAHQEDVVEGFRVSLSPHRGVTTSLHKPSVVQAVLNELRVSRDAGDNDEENHGIRQSFCSAADVPFHRSLRLDDDPIQLFTDNTICGAKAEGNVHSDHVGRAASVNATSLELISATHGMVPDEAVGQATAIPGVRLEAAVLPVYVFTRRSRSPDVYTREGASLHPFPPTARDKATAAAANGAQYVYYFDPEESQRESGRALSHSRQDNYGVPSPASPLGSTAQLPQREEAAERQLVSDAVGLTANDDVRFEWIDESEQKETARKKRKGKARRRRL